jgi:branched-chain amino acid transport system permease protein
MRLRLTKAGWIIGFGLGIAGIPITYFLGSDKMDLYILVLLWVLLGQAWNLLGGYTGQVSFGHAAFFGVGAYAAYLIPNALGLPVVTGLFFGGAVAAIFGLIIGAICFRLRGPFFALATLALAEVLRIVATNWESLTNGARGILIDFPFRGKLPYLLIAFALASAATIGIQIFRYSRLGYACLTVREDEDVAGVVGIRALTAKLYAAAISAFMTGVGGAFYLIFIGLIEPNTVFALLGVSITMILVVMLGGAATVSGPVLGALVYVVLNEGMRVHLHQAHMVVLGVILVLVIRFLPNGLAGAHVKAVGREQTG